MGRVHGEPTLASVDPLMRTARSLVEHAAPALSSMPWTGPAWRIALAALLAAGLAHLAGAPRTRRLARFGLLATTLWILGWAAANLGWARAGAASDLGLGAAAGAMLACLLARLAFPDAQVRVRRGLVWAALWGGIALGAAAALAGARWPAPLAYGAVALGLAAWALAAALTRDRGVRRLRGEDEPSVRFPCPRCGVRGDWARPVSPCNDCGLFVRVDWGEAGGRLEPDRPSGRRDVFFRCPRCRVRAAWRLGEDECPGCELEVRVTWNVQVRAGPG